MTNRERDRLECLYRHYAVSVQKRALSILHNTADAEDAAQNAFLKAAGYIDRFTDRAEDDQNRMLLLVMAKHAAIDILRRQKPTVPISERDIDPNASLDTLDADILHHDMLFTLLDELSVHNKKAAEAFLLGQLYGFTHREIADLLGIGVGYSQKLVMRAKVFMRESARRRGWIIALVLALLLLLAACGYIFRDFFKEVFDQFTSFTVAQTMDAILPDYRIDYVAPGYDLVDTVEEDSVALYIFANPAGEQYVITIEALNGFHVDTEAATVSVVEIDGHYCELYHFSDKDTKAVLFLDNVTVFVLGQLADEEILNILRSVRQA